MSSEHPPPVAWDPADMPSQEGRVAVVTGASSGLGAVAASALAAHGARVVMGVRDVGKGERVRAAAPSAAAARMEARELDLADLDSVRRFADALADAHLPVDILLNNAGVGRTPVPLSAQGFETTFATNHLGHFALTGLLLGPLEAAEAARVVTVSSNLYRRIAAPLPLEDLARQTTAAKSYVASKTANLLFATELERRLRTSGSRVRSLAAHPGVADTPMQRAGGTRAERLIGRALALAIGRSAKAGALPSLYAAVAPGAPGGVLLGPALSKRDMRVHAQPLVAPADDPVLAARLWAISEQATGVRYPPGAQRGSPGHA